MLIDSIKAPNTADRITSFSSCEPVTINIKSSTCLYSTATSLKRRISAAQHCTAVNTTLQACAGCGEGPEWQAMPCTRPRAMKQHDVQHCSNAARLCVCTPLMQHTHCDCSPNNSHNISARVWLKHTLHGAILSSADFAESVFLKCRLLCNARSAHQRCWSELDCLCHSARKQVRGLCAYLFSP